MKPQLFRATNVSTPSLFVSVEEAARILGVSRSLAYAMAKLWLTGGEDGLPSIRFGRRILVRRSTLAEMASTGAAASFGAS